VSAGLCEWLGRTLAGGAGAGAGAAGGASAGFDDCHLVALGDWPRWVLALAGAVAAGAVLLAWDGLRDASTPRRRTVLLALRAAAAAAGLLFVLEPGLALEDVERLKSRVVLLFDESASMSLADGDAGPRIDAARRFVADNAGFFEALAREHDVVALGVSEDRAPLPLAALADPARPASGASTSLRARLLDAAGTTTPAAAGAATSGGAPPLLAAERLGGAIIVSDGADRDAPATGAPLPEGAAADLRALGVPVHTFAAGDPAAFRDVAVAALHVDDFAFVRNAVEVDATIDVLGFEKAMRVDVELRKEGAVVLRKTVPPGDDPAHRHVTFSLVPDAVGTFVYSVRTPLLGGEATPLNNEREFVIEVIRDKIRVLQVCGAPSWDERFLRKLLKKDPNVDLISFFILRSPSDDALAASHELSLIPFPTEELFGSELPGFDVVIFQNFNYRPYGMSLYLDEVREYVEGGGGFVMVGGDLSFGAGQYAGTPVEDALPFPLVGFGEGPGPGGAPIIEGEFRPRVTDAGLTHPVTALGLDPAATKALYAGLPPLVGMNAVGAVPDGTAVLLEHPTARGPDGKPAPLVAVRDVGKGRSLAVTTDTLWRWNFAAVGDGDTSEPYYELWRHAIRWLIKDPELALLRLTADKRSFAVGDKVHLDARAFTPVYAPAAGVVVTLEVDPPGAGPLRNVALTTGDDGAAALDFPLDAPGAWRFRARATIDGRPAESFTAVVAAAAGRELDRPAPRPDVLRAISEATGGELRRLPVSLDASDVADLGFRPAEVARVNRRRDVPLWATWWTLGGAALLLGAEWWLRRRWGYL
jgi:uncharacterized membrane protein